MQNILAPIPANYYQRYKYLQLYTLPPTHRATFHGRALERCVAVLRLSAGDFVKAGLRLFAETRNTLMESFKTLTIASGIFLFFMAVTTLIEGIPSKCHVDTHGTFAHVTCTFNVDISEIPNDFQVDHIRSNDTNNNQDTVFMSQKSQGKLEYKHRPGYELFGTVGKTVTLKILELSQEHAGSYMCAVIPSDPNEVELCDLLPEGIGISTKAPTRSSDGPTVPPTRRGNEDPYSPYLPLFIGFPVGGIAVFAIIAALLYIFYRRRKGHIVNLQDTLTSKTLLMPEGTRQDKEPV